MKLLRRSKKLTQRYALKCSCGCDHLQGFRVPPATLRVVMDMDKCTCRKGTQHVVIEMKAIPDEQVA